MDFTTLIQQPETQRDDKWEAAFLTQFVQLKVQLEGEQAQQGPDGWPYLQVRTGPQGQEPVTEIIRWLAAKGIGLVVNAHKMMPDYVFTYGMLWNYVETGSFAQPSSTITGGAVDFSKEGKSVFGPPSEKYMPPYVRGVIREFLRAQGFLHPKVLVATNPDFSDVDLVLSLESLGGLPASEHKKFAEMMGWFLPFNYSFVLGEEAGMPKFHPL